MSRLSPSIGRVALAACALAALILGAVLLLQLRAFLMQHRLILAAALVAVGLAGCAGLPGITAGASSKDFLQHMEMCNRHYEGAIGGPAITGSFKIDCPASLPQAAP